MTPSMAKAKLTQRFAAAIRAKLLMEAGQPPSPAVHKNKTIKRQPTLKKKRSTEQLVNLKTRKHSLKQLMGVSMRSMVNNKRKTVGNSPKSKLSDRFSRSSTHRKINLNPDLKE